MSAISVNNRYPFEPFIRQPAVKQKAYTSSAPSEKVQSVSEKTLGKSEALPSPAQGFIFDELQDQYKIHFLTFFDLPELAEFSLTSTTANALASDFQIWNSIAKRINCPIDKASDRPIFKQVLDFIGRIQKKAMAIENRPNDITQSLKGPTIDQINTIQKWLQTSKALFYWLKLTDRINGEFPGLNLEGPGAIDNLTTQETIAKAIVYREWHTQNATLLNARDNLIVWRQLAASANLPGPNLAELNTKEDIITKSSEFDAWFNANHNELIQLIVLNLANKKLTSIPEQIGQLSQLEKLDLGGNKLTSIPEQIGQLSKLEKLDLVCNNLTSIPEQIGQLSQLEKLNLGFNQLTSIPRQLSQLSQLENLHLGWNQLTSIPQQLSQLSQLKKLCLRNNELTSIPEQIGQLSQLSDLDLGYNQLTSLPEQIGQLPKLERLDLSNNRLTLKPEQIDVLSKIRNLNLSNNSPDLTIPKEVGQPSPPEEIQNHAYLNGFNIAGNLFSLKHRATIFAKEHKVAISALAVAMASYGIYRYQEVALHALSSAANHLSSFVSRIQPMLF